MRITRDIRKNNLVLILFLMNRDKGQIYNRLIDTSTCSLPSLFFCEEKATMRFKDSLRFYVKVSISRPNLGGGKVLVCRDI